jgi:hypothetical protein
LVEQKRIVKSPLKAIALALAGIVVLLGAAAGAQLFLAYEMSLWESAADRLPASVQYFGYAGGVVVAVLVGFVAPPVGRLGRAFERKFVRWLVSFSAGVAAIALVVGGAMFAMGCIAWRPGAAALGSVGQYLGVFAALAFGGWGAVKAIKG